ncbi:uncharacterized protein BJ171DRAFT_515736 [Polychytrium aggregatum]|uniref:uncharacterized protein n=1 Tax=Polychytrium aggregatum TaxID=110093 RepID=UPI0022FDF291|nr:uncharacterized protein BJ171DRAFT_515736 [Polychytrium aggregatum]KAI9202115.1 hypothetical protein BJ171DRAFT_515736 [Polychytrium aggregatum]
MNGAIDQGDSFTEHQSTATHTMSNASGDRAAGALADNDVELLIQQGTEAFAKHEYEKAVDLFGEAVTALAEQYGEGAPEGADALFLYGQALLSNALSKTNVLNAASSSEVRDAELELPQKSSSHFVFEDEGYEDDSEDPAEQAEGQENPEEEDEGEEEDDMQLAWDILELARISYERMEDPEKCKPKLAAVHMALGDISLESERWREAVEDYLLSVKLKESYLSDDNRQLAEVHYKLALALEYSERPQDALGHVEKTIHVLEKRVALLESISSGGSENAKGKGKMSSEQLEAEKELQEIRGLYPEMKAKLDDLRLLVSGKPSINKEIQTALKQAVQSIGGPIAAEPLSASRPAGIVHDISSLVKKKETADDASRSARVAAAEIDDVKKRKDPLEDDSQAKKFRAE